MKITIATDAGSKVMEFEQVELESQRTVKEIAVTITRAVQDAKDLNLH
jgi:hypothetical protein